MPRVPKSSLKPQQSPEPDLATAETLDPDSAVVSPARLQSPDQAMPGVSAFQARLHSMLPQLPTLDKLAQLTLEVSVQLDSYVHRHNTCRFHCAQSLASICPTHQDAHSDSTDQV